MREDTLKIESFAPAALALGFLVAAPVSAPGYPTKPVRIVVGFAAGSVSDIAARMIGQKLGSALGQPFVVEVRPGAGSNVAAQSVVRSPKDGYTLFIATSSSTIRSPSTENLGFDFATDLTPIALIARVPFVLTAYPGLGVRTLQEFIALAKTKPETLTFGGTAVGTTGHLAAQLFNQRAGTNLVIAPYPSTAQSTTDLITGRISIAFASAANVLPLIEEGKLSALAVAQPGRAALIPHVPSIDEAGLPGVHASIWIGMLAPAGTRYCRRAVEGGQCCTQIRGCCESNAIAGHGPSGRKPGRFRSSDQARHSAMGRRASGSRPRQVAMLSEHVG
jgi:tripartite-type tricarboxylate transporter receptor subunit TctC